MYKSQPRFNYLTLRNTYPNDIIIIEPKKKTISSKRMEITNLTFKYKK
ncbi:hypothetical protein SAMN02799633_01366 [Bacillus sp. UNCCL81]|nr:hypothetical protein SAMN02799633_01366 [Bacillus sp. UNCCL81]